MADFFGGMGDLRSKPRMLRSLIRDHLVDGKRPFPISSELASLLSHVQVHALLSERDSNPDPNPKTMEAWRSAVDEWVDCLTSLISSNMPDKCWAGICLLGVTCESCTSQRFLASYSLWFQKLLSHIQPPSSTHFVKVASCASLADLFSRLASFPNVKKDATSLAGQVLQPILNLLNEDGAETVWEGAIDLLCTVISSFPSSIQRHYDKVEGVLVSKLLAKSNSNMSRKFAYSLSILPKVRGDEDSWSLLMHRILISIHVYLNDTFQGLEEESKNSEIMRLLVPPGKDPPPPLGGQLASEASEPATRLYPGVLIPRVSSLMHCCSMMLTNSYPAQVTVPIYHLLLLVGRVLVMDGSLHTSLLPFTTALHQELLCTELPGLHLDSLDLLIAVIKGVRSQLLPHAAHVARLLTDYFRRAALPSIRTKVYSLMQTLLISFGVGMALYVAQEIINNALIDLNDCLGTGGSSSSMCLSKSTCEVSQQSGHRKRKHASGSTTQQPNRVIVGAGEIYKKMFTPLPVKIAALKAVEALLTVGGSLRSESWRSNVDSLIINVATNACDVGWAREEKYPNLRDGSLVSQADFQLAALEALLASLLSPAQVRPPYLSQGLELFRRGKQETGTKLAAFCAHALLALEILIHPRSLPLIDAPVPKTSAFEERFNYNYHNFNTSSFSRHDPKTIDDLDDDNDDDLYNSWINNNVEPKMDDNDATKHTENQEQSLRGFIEEAQVEKNLVDEPIGEENMEIHQEPIGDNARFTKDSSLNNGLGEPTNTNPIDVSSSEMERGNATVFASYDSNLNKDVGNQLGDLGVLFKDQALSKDAGNNFEDLSISFKVQPLSNDLDDNWVPDIVDVDPDDDDDDDTASKLDDEDDD